MRWEIDQWVAYLKDRSTPVLLATREIFQSLKSPGADASEISPREITALVNEDPYLAVKLLREAERLRSKRLGKETTTQLAAILPAPLKRRPERMNQYSAIIQERMRQMGW